MRFAVYLSGETGHDQGWYRERDTCVESVKVPSGKEDALIAELVDCGVLESAPSDWNSPLPHISASALEDYISDSRDDLGPDSPSEYVRFLEDMTLLLSCEASVGHVWIVRTGTP